ncbi:hypothetical protein [Thermocrinis sp.]|uniref:hypothetical protein n=1 Tax=Thermocrinis sp. TaxID=2024383 RepID=UPI002FDC807A
MEESNRFFDLRLQLRGEIGNTLRTGAPITKAYSQEGWRVGVEIILPIFDPTTPFNLIELSNQKKSLLLEIEDSIKQLELTIHSAEPLEGLNTSLSLPLIWAMLWQKNPSQKDRL